MILENNNNIIIQLKEKLDNLELDPQNKRSKLL